MPEKWKMDLARAVERISKVLPRLVDELERNNDLREKQLKQDNE